MSSYYSVDYCGTARNTKLHTSTSSTRYCAGETEGRRSGQGLRGKDAHGWPAQARNGECPVKAQAVWLLVLFWRLNPQYMKITPST